MLVDQLELRGVREIGLPQLILYDVFEESKAEFGIELFVVCLHLFLQCLLTQWRTAGIVCTCCSLFVVKQPTNLSII